MKPRSYRILIVVVATLLVLLVLRSWRSPTAIGPNDSDASSSVENSSAELKEPKSQPSNSNPSFSVESPTGEQQVFGGAKQVKAIETLSTLNDVPIQFYGLLLDQFENAIGQAEITGSVLYDNGQTSGTRRMTANSDSKGLFRFDAGKGESLGVMPRKAGYLLASTNTMFKYSHFYPLERHIPDESRPVVIKMWKVQGAEDLVQIDKKFKIPFPEKPLRFDLVAGTIVDSGGDLLITCYRSAGILSKRNPGDWRITIEAIDGGVMEVDNLTYRTTFQAPVEGYVAKSDIRMDATITAWFDNVQRVLFAKSRHDKVFSKFYFSFHLNELPEGVVTIAFRGLTNAHGSRNWEEASQ